MIVLKTRLSTKGRKQTFARRKDGRREEGEYRRGRGIIWVGDKREGKERKKGKGREEPSFWESSLLGQIEPVL